MPTIPCTTPGCPNPAHYKGRCPTHARKQEQHRNTRRSAQRHIYNSKRWALTRSRQLFNHPLCQTPGCNHIATDVHHHTDLDAGGNPWAAENLESLCHDCHSRTTRARQTQPA